MTVVLIGLVVLLALAIAGGAKVAVVALNAQREVMEVADAAHREAFEKVAELMRAQAKLDADERHTLADRLQHPEIARPFRTAPGPREPAPIPGGFQGLDLNHLTDAEIVEEFGKDFLDADS